MNDKALTSGVSSFEGTFDGQGHRVSNFSPNTWEMFGDYNDGYSGTPNHYKDAMGLFGYVLNGTVKNLTVDNFSCDGEFTPTGVIAAYACNANFENIAITNCNPRVYNTGNGGIVGIGVNNDVCGNYQYYWYRYAGMLMSTNKNMKTDADGYPVPETDKFHDEDHSVNIDSCERCRN